MSGLPSSLRKPHYNFNKLQVELALVPSLEHVGHLETTLHDVIDLYDQLHVTVLDAVVYHLDVMAGAVFFDPRQ